MLPSYTNIWPIYNEAGKVPGGWSGWPEKKKFALVLTHDVERGKGRDKCEQLMRIEERLGFRSAFYFVPRRYEVSSELRHFLVSKGFEVGVHGLEHDGKLYNAKTEFKRRSVEINKYLQEWNSYGFSSPCMHHNLEWIHDLDIRYDISTYDTDPFEPQGGGMGTIFPFCVQGPSNDGYYVELQYTLPQDFTLFILMKQRSIEIWKKKLDWIVEHGGMVHLKTHPDYMNFDNTRVGLEEYPAEFYTEFLEYIKHSYDGQYWHVLPKDLALFCSKKKSNHENPKLSKFPEILCSSCKSLLKQKCISFFTPAGNRVVQ
jgi:hypothetical protein